MTGPEPSNQWYIARDGRQYGPLSEAEMRLFVAGGHLKPTDLIWRPGFPDWRPAPAVFPPQTAQRPPPPPGRHPTDPPPAPHSAAGSPAGGQSPQLPEQPGAEARPGANRVRDLVRVEPHAPAVDDEQGQEARRRRRKLAVAMALTLVVAGGAWAAYKYGGTVARFARSVSANAPASAKLDNAPLGSLTGSADAIDSRFQKSAMWSVVKKEFPEWYGERLKEAAKLSAEKKPDDAIAKHLVEALVALRRKHAEQALSASTPKLQSIAASFLENLKKLREHSTEACYSFISQGEVSPHVIEILQKPEMSGAVQAQVTAVFEAIADGRRSPNKHNPPQKADYDALADQLTRLGWSQADLQLFADPRALARSSPDRVCKMVQEWFSAHISIKDKEAQERLLVETLRPVVSG